MKGWHVHTKPNGVTIQTTLYLTHISCLHKSVCLLEQAVPLTHEPHSLPPTCYEGGSESFRPDQLFKLTEIKQLCHFSI